MFLFDCSKIEIVKIIESSIALNERNKMKRKKQATNYLHIPVTPNDFVYGKIACINSKYKLVICVTDCSYSVNTIHHL